MNDPNAAAIASPESLVKAAPVTSALLEDHNNYRQLTRTTQLIRSAILKRWPVDPDLKAAVLEKARQWLADGTLPAKEQAAWAKVIVAAEAQNQADELREEEYKRLDEGKLTANSGHTLILDGPIRPQGRVAQITGGAPSALPPLEDTHD